MSITRVINPDYNRITYLNCALKTWRCELKLKLLETDLEVPYAWFVSLVVKKLKE